MYWRGVRTVLLSVATIAGSATAATGAGAAPRPFSYSGSCDDVIVLAPVPAARLRPFLPRGYVALGDQGGAADRALLGVTVCRGSDLRVGGRRVGPAVFNDVIVPIRAPAGCARVAGGCDGFHFYALWQTGSSQPVRTGQRRLGERGALVPRMAFDVRHTLPEGSLRERGSLAGGSIFEASPWRGSPFTARFHFAGTPAAGTASANHFWQVSRSGAVIHITTAFRDQSLTRPVAGTLNARSGSPLELMLGATSVRVGGVYSSFDFTQRGERWAAVPKRRATDKGGT